MNLFTNTKNRLGIVAAFAITLFGAAPLADAGTYSIIGVEWYPTTAPGIGTDGGYIRFGTLPTESPLDIYYGLHRTVSAPTATSNTVIANPTASGIWKWKVRWVGSPNEAHPQSVTATAQYKGEGTAFAEAYGIDARQSGPPVASVGDSHISDPNFEASAHATSTRDYVYETETNANTTTTTLGAGGFVNVGGNTWEGSVLASVNIQATLSASGNINRRGGTSTSVDTYASASADLDVQFRLTHVDGQRVQADIP